VVTASQNHQILPFSTPSLQALLRVTGVHKIVIFSRAEKDGRLRLPGKVRDSKVKEVHTRALKNRASDIPQEK